MHHVHKRPREPYAEPLRLQLIAGYSVITGKHGIKPYGMIHSEVYEDNASHYLDQVTYSK